MLVRLYEVPAAEAETVAGWPALAGRYAAPLPMDPRKWPVAMELAISAADAMGRPLDRAQRRAAARRLLPWATNCLLEGTHETLSLVVRLDGHLRAGGLADALTHLGDELGQGRFSLVPPRHIERHSQPLAACLMAEVSLSALAALAGDAAINLAGHVRLRVLAVPEPLVADVLQAADADEATWRELLGSAAFVLGPAASLESLVVIGRGLDATTVKQRLASS